MLITSRTEMLFFIIILEFCPADVDKITEYRLVGSTNVNEGRVEVFHQGVWGTVCDDGWSSRNAAVVCRELGLPTDDAQRVYSAHFGEGTGPIWLDDVSCDGSESSLYLCSHDGWGNHNCRHNEDAGVICAGNIIMMTFIKSLS